MKRQEYEMKQKHQTESLVALANVPFTNSTNHLLEKITMVKQANITQKFFSSRKKLFFGLLNNHFAKKNENKFLEILNNLSSNEERIFLKKKGFFQTFSPQK